MNWILLISIFVVIAILLPLAFLLFAKKRKTRIIKQKNYSIIKARFRKPNRSSKGSPY